MALSDKTAALAKQWLEWDYNPSTHAEIQHLVDEKNETELAKRLHQRIDFGTAGSCALYSIFGAAFLHTT